MARKLRLEAESGLYHIINRGNYRADIFRSDRAKRAFLKCLDEACEKTGWRVCAWCLMPNHYHLAIETPRPNLMEGMRWLQSTFSMRFNRLRKEHGHLFQGRYKSIIVDSDSLGALCHYIHLNPVRAKSCTVAALSHWEWSSFNWLCQPKSRAKWYSAEPALAHAGRLSDSARGRTKYIKYLGRLSEDDAAQKAMNFEKMSKGWAFGSKNFKKTLIAEHKAAALALKRGNRDEDDLRQQLFDETLTQLLQKVGKRKSDLAEEGKSVSWKVAVGAAMKQKTTVTNRWLGENLHLGNMHEVSRKISRWLRWPEGNFVRKLSLSLP